MQGRIVNIIKDIWETMKKEIGGPKIKKLNIEGTITTVERKNLKNEIDIKNNIFFEKIEIKDIKNESKPYIYEAIPTSNTKSILNLSENVKIEENNILIENIIVDTENKDFAIKNIIINKKEFNEIKVLINNFFIGSKMIKCYNSMEKIQKLPKKIFGKNISEISRDDIEEILKGMKLKFPDKNFSKYRLYSVFKNIPVDSLKNIKYYKEINMMELYFGGRLTNKKSHFIILEDRYTNEIDKFFL